MDDIMKKKGIFRKVSEIDINNTKLDSEYLKRNTVDKKVKIGHCFYNVDETEDTFFIYDKNPLIAIRKKV